MDITFLKRLLSSVILIPIIIILITQTYYLFNLLLIICLIIASYEWYRMSKNILYHLLGFLFLIFSFYMTYELKIYKNDYNYLLFALLTCIATDIGGYVCGKILKGPKLTSISPNKTYAGLIGGWFFSLIFVYFFFQIPDIFITEPEITFKILFLILLISLVCQIGDIVISYFKRKFKIKDTGNLIPGHGGLLDRIDGMIFAFPFFYIILLLNFIKVF